MTVCLRVRRLALGAVGVERCLEGAELGGELLVLTLEGLEVEEGGGGGEGVAVVKVEVAAVAVAVAVAVAGGGASPGGRGGAGRPRRAVPRRAPGRRRARSRAVRVARGADRARAPSAAAIGGGEGVVEWWWGWWLWWWGWGWWWWCSGGVAARLLQRLRLVALAAVRAEELLLLAVLRLRQLLEVRRLGGAVQRGEGLPWASWSASSCALVAPLRSSSLSTWRGRWRVG